MSQLEAGAMNMMKLHCKHPVIFTSGISDRSGSNYFIHSTVQRLLTATPEQRSEPLIQPNNKVPANVALVLMVSLLPIAVTPVIRFTASSPGPDKTSNAGTTASGRSASVFFTPAHR